MATRICSRTPTLRCLASSSRTLAAPRQHKALFSTSAARALTPLQQFAVPSRPAIICRIPPQPMILSIRNASSTPATPDPLPSSRSPPPEVLTWDRFFDLRRKRRYINLAASVASAAAAIFVVGPVLAQQDLDSWGAQISGLDPMIVMGIGGIAVAAGGWLCGPSFGSAMFAVWAGRRGWMKAIAEKEKSFYHRIKRFRADPSSSSPQNPIPDYYGEKIASVKDYRRWLKDQRAFNLKKDKAMI